MQSYKAEGVVGNLVGVAFSGKKGSLCGDGEV